MKLNARKNSVGPPELHSLRTRAQAGRGYLCLGEGGRPAAGTGVGGEQRVGELQGGGGRCRLIFH